VAFLPENLTASYSASTMQAFGELGLRRRSGRALVESFVNLAHVRSSVEAFSETGGIAALDTEASSVSTTFATLGLRADGRVDGAILSGMIGWRYAFGDLDPVAAHSLDGSDLFGVRGAPLSQSTALVEAGMSIDIGKSADLAFSYAGQFGTGMEQHGVSSTFTINF